VVALPWVSVPQVGFAVMSLPLSRAAALVVEIGAAAEELRAVEEVGAAVALLLSTAAHSSRKANPH
jgi:hypothetical protein